MCRWISNWYRHSFYSHIPNINCSSPLPPKETPEMDMEKDRDTRPDENIVRVCVLAYSWVIHLLSCIYYCFQYSNTVAADNLSNKYNPLDDLTRFSFFDVSLKKITNKNANYNVFRIIAWFNNRLPTQTISAILLWPWSMNVTIRTRAARSKEKKTSVYYYLYDIGK